MVFVEHTSPLVMQSGVLTDASCLAYLLRQCQASVVYSTSMREHPDSHCLCPVITYVICSIVSDKHLILLSFLLLLIAIFGGLT